MDTVRRFRGVTIAALLLVVSVLGFAQSNKSVFLPGNVCSATPATLAVTASGLVRAAAGNGGVQFWTIDNAGGTLTINCKIDVANRIGSSAKITSLSFFYGNQATAATAVAAAVVSSVAYTTPGGAAAGTVATAGGVKTVVPAVLQFAATTTGQCYNERISFATPLQYTDGKSFTFEQAFTFGAATSTLQVCGIQINYTDPQ